MPGVRPLREGMKALPYSRVTLDSPFAPGHALARLREATAPRRRLETFKAVVSADQFWLRVPGTRGAALVRGRVLPAPAGSRVEAVIRPRGPVTLFLLFWWAVTSYVLKEELRALYLTGGMNMWVWVFVAVGALYSVICLHAWRREEREARELLARVFQDGEVYFDRY